MEITNHISHIALDEYQAKSFLKTRGIDVVEEYYVHTADELSRAAKDLGYPVVVKGCSARILHKSDAGLVIVDIRDEKEVRQAYERIQRIDQGIEGILVQRMIPGRREFLAGIAQDPAFGSCVVFGLGGVLTEALRDITYLIPPFTEEEAWRQCQSLSCTRLLGSFRGDPPVSQKALTRLLLALGDLAHRCPDILEVDLNPVKPLGDRIIAVDALLIVTKEFDARCRQ